MGDSINALVRAMADSKGAGVGLTRGLRATDDRLEPAHLGDRRVPDVPLDLHGLGRLLRPGARCQLRRRGTATTAAVELRSGRRGVDGARFVPR
jgi:hypothetical protein